MQLKIYKRSTALLGVVLLAILAAIIGLIITRESWDSHFGLVLFLFVLFVFILTGAHAYYDTRYDIDLIRKMVINKKIALAFIKEGSFVRLTRDVKFKQHLLWNLDIDLYDLDMNKISTSTIEKFNILQKSIPHGHVYVTYDPEKPERIFIVPNLILTSVPELAPIVEMYESNVKTKYLNAFYNNGNRLMTYKDSYAEEKENERIKQQAKDAINNPKK